MSNHIKLFWIFTILTFTGCYPVDQPVFDGTVKDIDGNVYHTVKIGSQTWMMENLQTTHYSDSTAIPMIGDSAAWTNLITPAYCWYNNDSVTNKNVYGALYNWYSVNTGKLAPKGWHVATNADWSVLENTVSIYLYTSVSLPKILASRMNWTTSITMGAIGNNPGINNSSGFSALPGGSRENNKFSFNTRGTTGNFWSSTVISDTTALSFVMSYNQNSVDRHFKHKWNGLSVRCVKD